MIVSMFVVVTAEEEDQPEASDDSISYSNCVDANGNPLNVKVVSGAQWVEDENGAVKMPAGVESSFLLFDTPLTTNRIEATVVINDNTFGDPNHRNGIVFALTDIQGDLDFWYGGDDVSYYWAFINDWACVELWEMGAHQNWATLVGGSYVDLYSIGANPEQGVTLAAEWDDNGHIKVFADGTPILEANDPTPLTGKYYGMVVNKWGNTQPSDYQFPYNAPVTSFVAGDAKLAITAAAGEGGTVTEGGEYYRGQSVTLTATPDEGHKFLGWYTGDEFVSKEATISFKAAEDCAFTAKFISFDEYQHILVESTETNLGDEVVVTLVIKNNPGIAGLVASLNYNAEVLTLVGAENGTLFSGFEWADNLLWDEAFSVTEDGVLVTLTFAVAEGAEIGDYTIEVIVHECYDENIEDVDLVTIGGTVTVNDAPDIMYGDVNGDGAINAGDATLLKEYLANYNPDTGTSTETVEAGADVNGDEVINARDATLLKKYLANYNPNTGTSTEVLGPKN
jgi:hypothetical protein